MEWVDGANWNDSKSRDDFLSKRCCGEWMVASLGGVGRRRLSLEQLVRLMRGVEAMRSACWLGLEGVSTRLMAGRRAGGGSD